MASATTGLEVPFVDLEPSTRELRAAILADIADLFDSGHFHYGKPVMDFEARFAEFCGTEHCVGVSSGIDGLRLALLAAGVEPGDEVLVPAGTFIATFAAVRQAGGIPVPVDVTESDYTIDATLVEAAVGARTRFLVPVHLYGQLADMQSIMKLADRLGVEVIEDACQAHGATRDGLRAGAIGRAGAFSFYPSKNLGAAGDAGAVVTDDVELASRLRALRHHGETEKYRSTMEGYTARLDAIQAIVLLHKLPLLERWNEERRRAARFYSDQLEGVGDLRLPVVAPGSCPVWHLYVIRTGRPDDLAEHLRGRGIGTGRHYPEPPHLSAAYADLGFRPGAFPVAEAIAKEGLSLPLYPGITPEQLAAVVAATRDYFG